LVAKPLHEALGGGDLAGLVGRRRLGLGDALLPLGDVLHEAADELADPPPRELQHPVGHAVDEVAVVAHEQQRAGERRQLLLQPGDAVDVEVVGRLVEQEHVGPGDEDPAQRRPHPPPARQLGERAAPVLVGEAEPGQDPVGFRLDGVAALGLEGRLGVTQLPQQPFVLGAGGGGDGVVQFLDPLRQAVQRPRPPQRLVEGGTIFRLRPVLGQVGQRHGGRAGHGAGVGPLLAGQDLQQRGLARPVAADQRQPPPRAQRDRHVGEQDALAVRLGQPGTGEHLGQARSRSPRAAHPARGGAWPRPCARNSPAERSGKVGKAPGGGLERRAAPRHAGAAPDGEVAMRVLQSYVAGTWVTPSAAGVEVHDATTGEPVARVSSHGVDVAAALEYGRTVGGPALRRMTFPRRAGILKALGAYLGEHKEELYGLSTAAGATRSDAWLDVEGGTGVLMVYAGKGRRELPDAPFLRDGEPEVLAKDGSFLGLHLLVPREGVAVLINAFNFPVWGMLEKVAPALLAGVPVLVKPATPTAYVAEAAVRLMVDSGALPDGALQLVCGSLGDAFDHLTGQDSVFFTGSAA